MPFFSIPIFFATQALELSRKNHTLFCKTATTTKTTTENLRYMQNETTVHIFESNMIQFSLSLVVFMSKKVHLSDRYVSLCAIMCSHVYVTDS